MPARISARVGTSTGNNPFCHLSQPPGKGISRPQDSAPAHQADPIRAGLSLLFRPLQRAASRQESPSNLLSQAENPGERHNPTGSNHTARPQPRSDAPHLHRAARRRDHRSSLLPPSTNGGDNRPPAGKRDPRLAPALAGAPGEGNTPFRRRARHQAAAVAHSQPALSCVRPRSLPQPVSAKFRQAETSGRNSQPQEPPAGRNHPTGTRGSGKDVAGDRELTRNTSSRPCCLATPHCIYFKMNKSYIQIKTLEQNFYAK
ncbi:hypothetical protein NDU88_006659 [Pleurodeles waltl]|uniref:Uncharacterized protein n=1 Tax=Pleurodeles waltl TaxID=8319 RepID=A0AAV7TXS4_PLEWA|nr:hypothetical protein NDU88_006659 [Pleurodeles waltl]